MPPPSSGDLGHLRFSTRTAIRSFEVRLDEPPDLGGTGLERVAFSTRVVSSEPAERIESLRQTVERPYLVLDILLRPIEVSGTLRHESPPPGRDAA